MRAAHVRSPRGLWLHTGLPVWLFLCVVLAVHPAFAQTTFGALSNFDVFNETGQECHGFEIELEGITKADVSYTFGGTYLRYGTPLVTESGGKVFVRYESPYDPVAGKFTQATPMAPAVITPTDGHSCFTGGTGNYLTSGCEHFGVGLNANPTNTIYRWLIADPAIPGNLIASGTKVSIPAPTWNVLPNPVPANPQPVIQAVIRPEPPEAGALFGDAQWVKVFVTESPDPVDLHHLVTDDPVVPDGAEPAEVETEWVLIQDGPGAVNELIGEKELGAGNNAVTRRYEFYRYTGAYNPEDHEAQPLPLTASGDPDAADLGNYIGAQMAALNLAAPPPPGALTLAPSRLPKGEFQLPYDVAIVTGGLPAYDMTITKGTLPAGLTLDGNTGHLSGIPDLHGKSSSFTLQVTDSLGDSLTRRFSLAILKDVEIATHTLRPGKIGRAYKAGVRATLGLKPYTWALIGGTLPAGLSFDPATGTVSGVPTAAGTVLLTFEVTDSLGATAQGAVDLTIK